MNFCRIFLNGVEVYSLSLSSFSELFDQKVVDGLRLTMALLFLEVELESTVAELEESNCKLAALKTDRDAAKGAFFPVLNFANKPVAVDVTKDKPKDLQDMESSIKELLVMCWLSFSPTSLF